jgi:hypothetical protein
MAVATAAHGTEWKTYVNDAVGYSVEYPANLRHIPYEEWAPQGDPNSAQRGDTSYFKLKEDESLWRFTRTRPKRLCKNSSPMR